VPLLVKQLRFCVKPMSAGEVGLVVGSEAEVALDEEEETMAVGEDSVVVVVVAAAAVDLGHLMELLGNMARDSGRMLAPPSLFDCEQSICPLNHRVVW